MPDPPGGGGGVSPPSRFSRDFSHQTANVLLARGRVLRGLLLQPVGHLLHLRAGVQLDRGVERQEVRGCVFLPVKKSRFEKRQTADQKTAHTMSSGGGEGEAQKGEE